MAVLNLNNEKNENMIRVCINEYKVPERGDKFANPHAQKATLGDIREDWQMSYSLEDGSSADIETNSHSLPSRMTVGFLLEAIMGKAAVLADRRFDGTPYHERVSIDEINEILEANGYPRLGKERWINATTGKAYYTHVYRGVCHYYTLTHEAKPKLQNRYIGRYDSNTHQSVTGIDNGGGQRMGPMEHDVIHAHGASDTIVQWSTRECDYAIMYTCKKCNSRIYPHNSNTGVYFDCKICSLNGDARYVKDVQYAITTAGQDIHTKLANAMGVDYHYLLKSRQSLYLPTLVDVKPRK